MQLSLAADDGFVHKDELSIVGDRFIDFLLDRRVVVGLLQVWPSWVELSFKNWPFTHRHIKLRKLLFDY